MNIDENRLVRINRKIRNISEKNRIFIKVSVITIACMAISLIITYGEMFASLRPIFITIYGMVVPGGFAYVDALASFYPGTLEFRIGMFSTYFLTCIQLLVVAGLFRAFKFNHQLVRELMSAAIITTLFIIASFGILTPASA